MVCLFCISLFSACDEEDEAFKDCLIEGSEIEDTSTTRSVNNVIRSIRGNTEPFVGTRQTFKVDLDRPLSINTRVRIVPSSDAIWVAYGSTYVREHTITVPVNASGFVFEVLITKPADNVDIGISSVYGGDFFVGRSDRITCTAPEININAPISILPNTQFEISTDHIVVPNLTKGYEWSYSSFRKVEEYLSGSKIKVILQAPTKIGNYSLGVKAYGKYNQGTVFTIGEVNIPITVAWTPFDFIPSYMCIFPFRANDAVKLRAYQMGGNQPYDHYEWKIPGGCMITYVDSNHSKAEMKVPKSGSYGVEVRGVIDIGGNTHYSDWKSITFDVRFAPFTIEYKLSKTKFLKIDKYANIMSGIFGELYPEYFMVNDYPYPQFLIGVDPQDPTIEYYYVVEGREEFLENLFPFDPVSCCGFIDNYPGVSAPIERVSVYYE